MRGAFLVAMVMGLLIVGLLVMKQVDTETGGDGGKVKKIEQSRQAAEEAEKAIQNMREAVQQSGR